MCAVHLVRSPGSSNGIPGDLARRALNDVETDVCPVLTNLGNQCKPLPRTRTSLVFWGPNGPSAPQNPPEKLPTFSGEFWGREGPLGPPK